MKVYLIRHAQSEENVLDLRTRTTISAYNEILRQSHISPLTGRGEEQARTVARELADRQIQRLYSSPFTRALATATIIGEAVGLQPQIVDDLREVLPLPMAEESTRERPLGRLFAQAYMGMLWPRGNHTWLSNYRRAKMAWAHITSEPVEEVVAVAHRGLIGLVLLSLRRSKRWRVLNQDLTNCGVSIVESRSLVSRPEIADSESA